MTSALEGVVNRGTGHALRALGYRGSVAGKTGTTNDARDAWFVGYTPELVAAVWVGFDDGTPLGLTGARAALPIFGHFLIAALGAQGGRDFVEPAGLERVAIHEPTGLRAGFLCWGGERVVPRGHGAGGAVWAGLVCAGAEGCAGAGGAGRSAAPAPSRSDRAVLPGSRGDHRRGGSGAVTRLVAARGRLRLMARSAGGRDARCA